MSFDVLVSGAGPAGTALVAACAARGLRVGWLAPEHREGGAGAPWTATYASWIDEVDADVPFDARWDVVYVHAGREHALRRPYGRIAGERLDHEGNRAGPGAGPAPHGTRTRSAGRTGAAAARSRQSG